MPPQISFRGDQHPAPRAGDPSVEQPKRPQPDFAGFRAALSPAECKAIERMGENVRAVSEAPNKPAFRAMMRKAHRHSLPKDRVLQIAIEEAHNHRRHLQRADQRARSRADGGTTVARRGPLGLSQRQMVLAGAALLVGVALLSAS